MEDKKVSIVKRFFPLTFSALCKVPFPAGMCTMLFGSTDWL